MNKKTEIIKQNINVKRSGKKTFFVRVSKNTLTTDIQHLLGIHTSDASIPRDVLRGTSVDLFSSHL